MNRGLNMNDRNDKQILAVLAIIGWALAVLNGFDLASSTVWSPTFAAYLQAFSALIAVRIAYSVPKKLQEREMRYREEEKAREIAQEERRDFLASLSLLDGLHAVYAEVGLHQSRLAVLRKLSNDRLKITWDNTAYVGLTPISTRIRLSDFIQRPGVIPDEVLSRCMLLNSHTFHINQILQAKTFLLEDDKELQDVFLDSFENSLKTLDTFLQAFMKATVEAVDRNPRAWTFT